jgi:hypothetical protein
MTIEPLQQKITRLERELETALVARRRYFLMSCACYELADVSPNIKNLNDVLSKSDAAMLDEGLDKYGEASAIVIDLRRQISAARQVLRVAEKQNVKL